MIRGALVVVLSLGYVGPARASAQAAAPATAEVIARASLELDTTAAGPSGPIIHSRIDELGNRQLRRAEILPGRGVRDPWIKITVRTLGSEEPGFIIDSALIVEGQTVPDSAHQTECRLCTEGEAVERATAEVERLVPLVRERAQAAAAAEPQPSPDPPKDTTPAQPEPPRGLGTKGKAGVALLAVGGVGFVVGVGLLVPAPRPDPNDPLREINTRPAGGALLGVGVAALITGGVLLALDRKAARRTSVAPTVSRTGAGLMLIGHF